MGIVYKILNKINNKCYIGSANNFEHRKSSHLRLLRKNKHHSVKLQRAWNKYKEENFEFSIIEECTENKLVREQFYIDILKPFYNISKSSSAPMEGRKHSKKSIKKMSGKIPWNRGVPRTLEEKQNMSKAKKEAMKSKPSSFFEELSIRAKNTIAGSFKGKHHTPENKKILRNQRKDKNGPILCVNNGKIYEAQLDIQRDLKIKQGHISEVLSGKRAHTKGFLFKYVNCKTPMYKGRAIILVDKHGNIYTNLYKAVRKYTLNYQSVQKHLLTNNIYNFQDNFLKKYYE